MELESNGLDEESLSDVEFSFDEGDDVEVSLEFFSIACFNVANEFFEILANLFSPI